MLGSRRRTTAREAGEHEVLSDLHQARTLKEAATTAHRLAERLMVDADEALAEARRALRRASER